jgi:hypothetical protein
MRFVARHSGGARHVDTGPADDGRQPAAEVVDCVTVGG